MLKTSRSDSSDMLSEYYKKHHKNPKCPFCGYVMRFVWNIYYEGKDEYWYCPECNCMLPNNKDFSQEYLATVRKKMRNDLKKEITQCEEKLDFLRERLKKRGRYMTSREKVKLLAEELET